MQIDKERVLRTLERLKFPEGVFVYCRIWIRPADLELTVDPEEQFEHPVLDRWILPCRSSQLVTTEVFIVGHPIHGAEQYHGIRSAINDCADLFSIPAGRDTTQWMIEWLFEQSSSDELNSKSTEALQNGLAYEVRGPELWLGLSHAVQKAFEKTIAGANNSRKATCVLGLVVNEDAQKVKRFIPDYGWVTVTISNDDQWRLLMALLRNDGTISSTVAAEMFASEHVRTNSAARLRETLQTLGVTIRRWSLVEC